MPQFQPYPIYDLRTGLYLAKEPWLSPQDAFSKLENCYLKRGVLEKRKGHTSFGRIAQYTDKIAIASFAAADAPDAATKTKVTTTLTHGYTDGNSVLIANCAKTEYNTTHVISNVNAGAKSFVIPVVYGAETIGGTEVVRKKSFPSSSTDVMGLLPYDNAGTTELLAFDRTRVNKYDTTALEFVDLTTRRVRYTAGTTAAPAVGVVITNGGNTATVDAVVIHSGTFAAGTAEGEIHLSNQTAAFAAGAVTWTGGSCTIAANSSNYEFTGDDKQFFWICNWNDKGYFTNGKDQIATYDGTILGHLTIDLDVLGGPDNDVGTAKIIVLYKNRLLLLLPTVDGSAQRQRAMWSEINLPGQWKAANYTDCPTSDTIVSAGFIGETLVVFFSASIWILEYTGNSTIPFKWTKVPSDYGCSTTYSLLEFSTDVWTLSNTRFITCNLRDVNPIDVNIPDMMLSFDQSAIEYVYGSDLSDMRQVWFSFVSNDSTDGKPDSILAINYDEMNWSTHKLPVHCFGSYMEQSELILDSNASLISFFGDADISLDDVDIALDYIALQAGYPINLMGCRTGYIYKLNSGDSDNTTDISFTVISGWWNPYTEQGYRAELGWIDFFVEAKTSGTCEIQLFINHKSSAYVTRTLKFDATGEEGTMTRYRVKVGTVADFHRIQIYHSTDNHQAKISALIPYFRQAGRLYS
jgi:hypothetical protein